MRRWSALVLMLITSAARGDEPPAPSPPPTASPPSAAPAPAQPSVAPALAPEPAASPAPAPAAPSAVSTEAVPRDRWGLPRLPGPTAPIPSFRLVGSTQLALRYNPLGLELFQRLGMQRRLFGSERAFFRDNYFYFGLNPRFSPVYARVGPAVELQPISMLNVRVTMEIVQFFPLLGFTTSYASPSADYSDSARKVSRDQKANYGPTGYHFMIEPTLSLRGGPIALRVRSSIEYWRMNLRNGDRVWYEPQLDVAVPANGWVFAQDWDLLYMTRFRFVAGLRYSLVMPLYDADDVGPGDSIGALKEKNSIHRLGPILAYTFFDKGLARFNRPSLILIAQWHVHHRFRTGADVSAGLPLIALAFVFQSDFLK